MVLFADLIFSRSFPQPLSLSLARQRDKSSLDEDNCLPFMSSGLQMCRGRKTRSAKALTAARSQAGGSRRALTFLLQGRFPPPRKVLVNLG